MNICVYVLLIINICVSIVIYNFLQKSLLDLCDINTCPFCYGDDICVDFKLNNINLKSDSLVNIIFNYISVKNIYFATYNTKRVVLKKLAHNRELNALNSKICVENGLKSDCDVSKINKVQNYKTKIINLLNTNNRNIVKHLKICDNQTTAKFLSDVLKLRNNSTTENDFLMQVWTVLQVNVEPFLLQFLTPEDDWLVPKYFGACGRLIVVENCGISLNYFFKHNWKHRAYLALQLLQAAEDFTKKHSTYRFYLTDISPDNIVVNENLKISYIDLENVVIKTKIVDLTKLHHSQHFIEDDNTFIYSEENICESSVSDHNIYSTCKLLLSSKAPWPMIEGGLLHSPPKFISNKYSELFQLIEDCVQSSTNRFEIASSIIDNLKEIIAFFK